MKIYVDNNVLCTIIGNNFTDETALAMEKLALCDHNFITSPVTKEEMGRTSAQKIKGAALFIYKIFGGEKFLNKEFYFATGLGDAPLGSVPLGGGYVTNPSLSILYQAFDKDDARHIYQALSSHSDYFLTLDEKTILKRYRNDHKNIKAFLSNGKMKIVNPVELTNELSL